MLSKIEQIAAELPLQSITSIEELENFRLKYLSKKGVISILFDEFKTVSPDMKKSVGSKLNDVKKLAESIFNTHKEQIESRSSGSVTIDTSLPGDMISNGSRHPISLVKNEICSIFRCV